MTSSKTFTLKSNTLGGQATHKEVFKGFGCDGENISPDFYWENAPTNTKSFAITIHDADAPTGSGWWHWLIFDLDKNVTELLADAGNVAKNMAPKGAIQSITDYGVTGYGGPCPPAGSGFHAYLVTLYALDLETLGLDSSTNPAVVGFNLNAHTIQKASLIFYFKK